MDHDMLVTINDRQTLRFLNLCVQPQRPSQRCYLDRIGEIITMVAGFTPRSKLAEYFFQIGCMCQGQASRLIEDYYFGN